MNRPEFEAQMSRLRERMTDLPPATRESLDGLVQETIARHDGIVRDALAAARAMERLELAQVRLADALVRFDGLAAQARATLARLSPPPATPGEA